MNPLQKAARDVIKASLHLCGLWDKKGDWPNKERDIRYAQMDLQIAVEALYKKAGGYFN